jgi:hypothetical protein
MTMCRIDGDVISNIEVFRHSLCLHSAYQLLSTSLITGVAVRGVSNVTYHVFFMRYLKKDSIKCCYLEFQKLSYKKQMENKTYRSKY